MSALADFMRWSPALARMYLRSVVPMLLWLGAVVLLLRSARYSPASAWGLVAVAAVCVVWMFLVYLRFLRECDELERRLELLAMGWGMCLGITVGTVLFLTLELELLTLATGDALAVLLLVVGVTYMLVRLLLRWHYR